MPYVYRADLYCDECGDRICERLTAAGKRPACVENESSFDSEYYPKHADNERHDSPHHCASGDKCLAKFRLGAKGNPVKTGGIFVSALITQRLTQYGIDYVIEAADRGNSVGLYWAKVFDQQISNNN
jgi:hypothetical protein